MTSRAAGKEIPIQLRPPADRTALRYVQQIPVILTRCQSLTMRLHKSDRPSQLTRIKLTQQFVPSVFTANIRGGFAQKVDELQAVIQEKCVDV